MLELDDLFELLALRGEGGRGDPDRQVPCSRCYILVQLVRHHVQRTRSPGDRLAALLAELNGYVPPAGDTRAPLGFAVPLELRSSTGVLRLMTAITSFATAVDVTLSELKLEAFLPADHATAAALTRQGREAGA